MLRFGDNPGDSVLNRKRGPVESSERNRAENPVVELELASRHARQGREGEKRCAAD